MNFYFRISRFVPFRENRGVYTRHETKILAIRRKNYAGSAFDFSPA
jgi:hypothetical protein